MIQCSVDRITSLVVFKWVRLNPNKIIDFILRMDREEEFRSVFKCCYLELREIFQRLHNVTTIELKCVDESVIKAIQSPLEKQRECLDKVCLDVEPGLSRVFRRCSHYRGHEEEAVLKEVSP